MYLINILKGRAKVRGGGAETGYKGYKQKNILYINIL